MPSTRRRAAAALIAVVGLIHLYLAPEYLSEHLYIGCLFVATGVACAFVAPRLWFRGGQAAWLLGAAVAASTLAGFLLSRTVGLPGFHEAEWELLGIVSIVVEALFLVLAVHRERHALVAAAAAVTPGVESRRKQAPRALARPELARQRQ
jgi:hypothetical protein